MSKEGRPAESKFKNSLARLKKEFSNLQRNWIEEKGAGIGAEKPPVSSKPLPNTLYPTRPIIKENPKKTIFPKKN